MRVAMVVSSFPEVSQKFLLNQIAGLLDAGVQLDIFAGMQAAGAQRHELEAQYGLRARTNYAGVPQSGKARLRQLPGLLLSCLALSPRMTARALSGRYSTAAWNLKNLYFLRAFAPRRYELVHCHFGPNGLVGAFLKDIGVAGKLVVSFHGSDINSYPRRHGKKVYRTLYQRADLVTANTIFTRNKIAANGCPPKKITVLPVGIRMNEHPETPFAERQPMEVLTVGRLVQKKGHRYALEAMASLRGIFPAVRYLVAGDGPEKAELENLAADLGITDSVEFLGACNDRQIAELYRRAAVFVLPSVTASDGDMEGQGLVLQEAQASGIPVVSTLHNGIPEGMRDGETGFLVPESDTRALAGCIERLLRDPALRQRMGAAGRTFASMNYDTPVLTKRLMEIYASVR